ncbi:MAG: precorrin-3B C(17)-methyltransferase [Lachnospiraceae bacterium]|nr:precorrin-3B C(17)-methyltransferase [Lachnospiraceae bacterium]
MGKIYVVGIGPGDKAFMTDRAKKVLNECDIIVGYRAYTDIVKAYYPEKEYMESAMKQEIDRCRACVDLANSGKIVALICSGDAGIYGMASPLYETAQKMGFDDVEIIPGITAASSGAALLGAPINHDFCVISLSDLLTPWELIENRIRCASKGDFSIVIYNPSSHKRADYLKKACDIMLTEISPDTVCGYVKNIGRDGTEMNVCTLKELAEKQVDMFTTVFIGNSNTKMINKKMVTPRGYENK